LIWQAELTGSKGAAYEKKMEESGIKSNDRK
jgi:hypothetical protein